MNPGPIEEIGQTVRNIISAINPTMLALVVSNIAMLVFIFYALHAAASFRQQFIEQMLKACSK